MKGVFWAPKAIQNSDLATIGMYIKMQSYSSQGSKLTNNVLYTKVHDILADWTLFDVYKVRQVKMSTLRGTALGVHIRRMPS